MAAIPRRMGRRGYACCVLFLFVPSFALGFFGFRHLSELFEFALLVSSIPRLHDVDRSGWWSLLLAAPFVAIAVMAGLLVWPGTAGENRFGPAPRF